MAYRLSPIAYCGTHIALAAALLSACSIQISDAPQATASATHPASGAPGTWADLHLTGQLVFITTAQSAQSTAGFLLSVAKLDLASGARSIIFQPPDNSWVTAASVSPDGKQLVLAYAPAPPQGQLQFGYTGLYLFSLAGPAQPQPLLVPAAPREILFNPVWSPDGQHIYYVHLSPGQDSHGLPESQYTIERLAYPSGQVEIVAQDAYWPRPASDGLQLAYVTFDPSNSSNALYVAGPDGKNPRRVAVPDTFLMDAPLFTPDGNSLIFSAADLGYSTLPSAETRTWGWIDHLLGVQTASAHSLPSDWWRVPITGGQPEQITHIADSGFYGDFSPDGQHLAFIGQSGLFVMPAPGRSSQSSPDGPGLLPILSSNEFYGTIDWIP